MAERLSDQLAVVATLDPESRAATGTVTSDVVDMSNFHQVVFVLMVGTLGATDTIDLDIQEGTSTATFNTATALKSITQLTGADDDKQVVVNVRGEDLTEGYRYIRAVLSHGGTAATADVALVALADQARFKPAIQFDLASVDEIVT